jgi:two-component system, OmpR family, sensor kinase
VKSIRRELLATLVGVVLVAGLIAALSVYYTARQEVGALLDYQMRQMALAVHEDALGRYDVIELPPYDFDYAIQISSDDGLRLYYARSRVRLPAVTPGGYHRVETTDGAWRVYTLQSRGVSVQIGQPMRVRTRLAAQAAWRTMEPFLLILPLLAVLVWFAVTRGFKPLEAAADAVKTRSSTSLDPLSAERLPQEIRPLVLAVNDLLSRLSRALEMHRAFIADAAHELRSPLTALRLQLQLAQRAQDEVERTAALDTLRHGLDRMTHLVEQLLVMARQEPNAAHAPREDVDVGELAAELVGLYAPIAEEKRIDLGLARRDANVSVRGEHEALKTVLSNLIDNALRYTPSDGRVDVSVLREERDVVLEVTDTGPGIPLDERQRVFDRFYRRAGADVPGSGLGLAIVRSIIERHGATVELQDSPDGRGLTARVVFPR